MSRFWWFVILGAVGVGFIILVAVLSNQDDETKSEAASTLCGSLDDPGDVDPDPAQHRHVHGDEVGVPVRRRRRPDRLGPGQDRAQDVQDASTGDLDSAWDDFESAVKDIPDDASVSGCGQRRDAVGRRARIDCEVDCLFGQLLTADSTDLRGGSHRSAPHRRRRVGAVTTPAATDRERTLHRAALADRAHCRLLPRH